MVFNTTFNNISVISWWSVLLVEETVPKKKKPDILLLMIKPWPLLFMWHTDHTFPLFWLLKSLKINTTNKCVKIFCFYLKSWWYLQLPNYAISVYHHLHCELEPAHVKVYSIQHYVIKWFSLATLVSSINKTDRHDITEILLKVALNTINQS
jgi:hypothetical protein